MSFTSIDEPKEASSPLKKGPRNRTSSDSVVDYHEYRNQEVDSYLCGNAQDNRDPGSSSSSEEGSDEPDTDTTEEHPEQETPDLLQAFFFSKELAQKMKATEIKESIFKQYNHRHIVCSVLQLKKPHGAHYIYLHTLKRAPFKLPLVTKIGGITVTLENPRKDIIRVCDCPKVDPAIPDPLQDIPFEQRQTNK